MNPSEPKDYDRFLEEKTQDSSRSGFAPVWMPDFLFDFQKALVEWALLRGKAALFADTGLGKTAMQLVWAENVVRHAKGRVLILTPLAVSAQTVKEAQKFGIEAKRSREGELPSQIVVTNYERLHYYNPADFAGVVCDESSILKSFDGERRGAITAFMRKVRYRLLATATAAPNDYVELGTSSEALGYLGHIDMLNKFFKNDQNNSAVGRQWGSAAKWRFKGHAELPFWRWVCSWARAIRRPSDLGFDDGRFVLPPLDIIEHTVASPPLPGLLFTRTAITLEEQRAERRITIPARCEMAAEAALRRDCSVVWCHLNEEGDLLEKMIPGAVQVSGSDSDDAKEERLLAFASGEIKRLVTKPRIGAFGLNWQHCAHMTFFPSHSFEQFYQGTRRCWRFGQDRPVTVDVVTSEGESGVLKNLQRKAAQADEMFSRLVAEMNRALSIERVNNFQTREELPSWL